MTTDFHEVQLPPEISYGFSGGPEYSTDITTPDTGYEQRNINWANARAKYTASFTAMQPAMQTTLLAFIRNRFGKAYGFRFKDWGDFQAAGQQIGIGDGTTAVFQLSKTYTDIGGFSVTRTINKPVAGTVIIYVNGVMTAAVTVDTTTGSVTFATAPPQNAVISADFQFDVPVRFDLDYIPTSIKSCNQYGIDNIQIIEIRV
jgi:uncharacterized protein (TIGR02217 family)